jgi:hypothetical protein
MCEDGAVQGGKHCVGILILHGDDEVCVNIGGLFFFVSDDVRLGRDRFECRASELKVVIVVVYVREEGFGVV